MKAVVVVEQGAQPQLSEVPAPRPGAGRLTVPVERAYPLAEVPAAFGAFAGGTLGKISVTVG